MGCEMGNSEYSTWDVGCGGLWRDVVEENGTNMSQLKIVLTDSTEPES